MTWPAADVPVFPLSRMSRDDETLSARRNSVSSSSSGGKDAELDRTADVHRHHHDDDRHHEVEDDQDVQQEAGQRRNQRDDDQQYRDGYREFANVGKASRLYGLGLGAGAGLPMARA